MDEYPKIQSIFKRDEATHKFIEGEFALPEDENRWHLFLNSIGFPVRFCGPVRQFVICKCEYGFGSLPSFGICSLHHQRSLLTT